MTRVGVIVPCRNEAAVIARKLANLALCRWPATDGPHELVVVDDHSHDGTGRLAREQLGLFEALGVRARVIDNGVRRGKSGAIAAGLGALSPDLDLVLLTDADVCVAPEALVAFADAFRADPGLAMASGAQTFVRELAPDGSTDGVVAADTLYDRLTNLVRRAESPFGLLFSVQGQWMAWRRTAQLSPTAGQPADDLDLMLQARCRGGAIRRVAGARFFEVRAPRGAERERQAVRRARAFVQFLRHPRIGALRVSGSPLARWQARTYLRAARPGPGWSVVPLLATAFAGVWSGPTAAIVVMAVLVALGAPLWIVLRMLRSRIEAAQLLESRSTLGDAWETARR